MNGINFKGVLGCNNSILMPVIL